MLGIVDESEFNKSLTDSKSAPSLVRIQNKGKQVGDAPIGNSVRKIISDEALTSGNNKSTADAFGVGISTIEQGKRGQIGRRNDDDLSTFIKSRKNALAEVAMDKLGAAMDSITDDKLNQASLKESADVAKSMASIVRDMTADDGMNNKNEMNVQFVLHAPEMKKLEDYQVIDLGE